MQNILPLMVSWASLTCIAYPPQVLAQPKTISATRFTATLKFQISADANTRLVVIDALLPQAHPGRQKIGDIRYSPLPTEEFAKDGQRYAQFQIREFPAEIKITIPLEVFRYDLATARIAKEHQLEPKESLRQWLIYEQYLEKDNEPIQLAAKDLIGKSEEATIRASFDFVTKTLKRRAFDEQDYGGAWAMQERVGDCSEFADLFVTLCRAQGIPARVCEGYLLEHVADTPKHGWAEVYFEDYGWVPFDPFYAFLRRRTTFAELRPIYLYLDCQRRNGVLNHKHYFGYRFEGTGKVTVKDSFSFAK